MKATTTLLLTALISSSAAFAGNTNSRGNRLILATYWGDDKVALLDLSGAPGREEVWAIDVLKAAGCAKPYDVRSNRKGDEAYVTCSGSDKIITIDIVAQQVKYAIQTGRSPRDLVTFDNDRRLIVANSGSNTVSVLDLEARRKIFDVEVANQPYGVAVSPDGKTAFVTGWASGDLHFLDLTPTSGSVSGKVEVGMLPYTVTLAGDPEIAYVAVNADHRVVAVSPTTKTVVDRIQVGRNPWSLASSADRKTLLVTNNRSNNLSLLKTGASPASAGGSQTFIAAGSQSQPNGQSVDRAAKNASISLDGKTGVFTDLANNQIVVVDLTSGALQKVIDVGKAPYGIEYVK